MATGMLVVVALAVLAACAEAQSVDKRVVGYVRMDSENKFETIFGVDAPPSPYVATGTYEPGNMHPSNFGVLKIETNSSYSDADQMYAAGYLEVCVSFGLNPFATSLEASFCSHQALGSRTPAR